MLDRPRECKPRSEGRGLGAPEPPRGSVGRSPTGTQPSLTIRSANIVLYDKDLRLLLQHRSEDARVMPGYWGFFGGSIEEGETPRDAAMREAFEELGYRPIDPVLVLEQDFTLPEATGRMHVFVDFFASDPQAIKLREGQGFGWFTGEETLRLHMVPHDRAAIDRVLRYLRGRRRESPDPLEGGGSAAGG